ncbi:hypothetical protein [Myxococcus sp. CA040A]|uniref:hypothetical protein n=1 Tax=Myxococcus sp. CA040A TaxID=2741738 RepID=UPI00157B2C0C|nr:hypothetical protein [Myxococcus sp. CA040A]NTX01788.1 hypothetical protein [Myxococcus sp. CA040A]
MSTFTSTSVQRAPADPTRHVNYVLGMVLGVDDFTQEFAYLSERDRWLARDLLGYGTAWGLAVSHGTGTRGPEVRVTPGAALTPRGQLVRVTPTQCAALNDWLIARGTEVDAYLRSGNRLTVYVVLRHRDCLTDPVPVPGEPCRTEDDTTAPSRVTDDFHLELALQPPPPPLEENAVRDFVRWLRRNMNVVSSSPTPTTLEQFVTLLRGSVVPSSPVSPVDDYVLDDPPGGPVPVLETDVESFLREASRLWVTELRPLWRTNWLGESQGCTQPVSPAPESANDGVLLAAVDLPLVRELGTGPWKVDAAGTKTVDETQRPYLLHQRMLQEWLLAGLARDASAVHHPDNLPPYSLIAAGMIPIDDTSTDVGYNGLKATKVDVGLVTLSFDGFAHQPDQWRYVVKATLVEPQNGLVTQPSVTFVRADADGLLLKVREKDALLPIATLRKLGLIVEVSQYAVPAKKKSSSGDAKPKARVSAGTEGTR